MSLLFALIISVLTFSPIVSAQTLSNPSSCPNLTRTLQKGSRGTDVTQLQSFLIQKGYLASDSATGYFGSLTENAVKQFQCNQSIVCSGAPSSTGYGLVGAKTRAAIQRSCSGTSTTSTTNTTSSNTSSSSSLIDQLNAQIKQLQERIAALKSGSSGRGGATQGTQSTQTTQTTQSTQTTQTTSTGNASCTFNNQTIAHGQSVTAYQSSSVASGQTCQSQTRTCSNGSLSGAYTASSCAIAPSILSDVLGVYHWGGYTAKQPSLYAGAKIASDAGLGGGIRIIATPRMRAGGSEDVYHLGATLSTECPVSTPFLPCIVRTAEYQKVIQLPGLSTIVISAYDSATSGSGWGTAYLDPTVLSSASVRAEVIAEYRDMTLALYEKHRGTNKTIIISNWESDNAIYCGSSYSYLTNPTFRSSCDAGLPTPSQKMAGMRTWFELRKEGIRTGRELAEARGLTGLTVVDGIQFNHYLALKNAGFSSVLFDIIPQVRPAYVDYSAWESIQNGTMDEDLIALRNIAESRGSRLMLGEVGLQDMNTSSRYTWRWLETVKAALRANVPTILWAAFPSTGLNDNLFSQAGAFESSITALRSHLREKSQSSGSNTIRGVTDRGVTGGKRNFEVYGSFSATGNIGHVSCDGTYPAVTVEYESVGQINLSIPDPSEERWCVFAISNSRGTGDLFGPRRVCANAPCSPLR